MKIKKVETKLTKLEHEIEAVLNTPLHLRVEYFFRKRYVLLAVMALLSVAIAKSDGRFLGIMHEAYNHGYDKIGTYLRNETVHKPHLTSPVRVVAAASK